MSDKLLWWLQCYFPTFPSELSAEGLKKFAPAKTSEWNISGVGSHCCWATLTGMTSFVILMGPDAYPTQQKNKDSFNFLKSLECGNNHHHGQSGKPEPTTLYMAATHDFRGCGGILLHLLGSICSSDFSIWQNQPEVLEEFKPCWRMMVISHKAMTCPGSQSWLNTRMGIQPNFPLAVHKNLTMHNNSWHLHHTFEFLKCSEVYYFNCGS